MTPNATNDDTPHAAADSIPAGQPDPRDPVKPGDVLKATIDAMPQPLTEVAERIGVGRNALYKLIRGDMPISAEMALRLGRVFGNSAEFWVNLQAQYDLKRARAALGDALDAIEPLERPKI